jgi:hypothetical protein
MRTYLQCCIYFEHNYELNICCSEKCMLCGQYMVLTITDTMDVIRRAKKGRHLNTVTDLLKALSYGETHC